MKMHHRFAGLLAVVSLGIGWSAHWAWPTKRRGDRKTFVGHVVGMARYMGRGSIGESHRGCVTTCARSGFSLAILDQIHRDALPSPAKNHHASANKELLPFVEQDVQARERSLRRMASKRSNSSPYQNRLTRIRNTNSCSDIDLVCALRTSGGFCD